VALAVEPREASAQAAADYYLKLEGIDGEVAVSGFAWNTVADVGSFERYATDVRSPRDPSTGQASGRRMHKPMTITKEWGPASAKLMQACVDGTHVGNVEVWSREGGQAALRYTLHDAIITSYSVSRQPDSSARPMEQVSFTFERIEVAPAVPAAATNLNSSRSN
jgi:type VI secretion system Hcp family effector